MVMPENRVHSWQCENAMSGNAPDAAGTPHDAEIVRVVHVGSAAATRLENAALCALSAKSSIARSSWLVPSAAGYQSCTRRSRWRAASVNVISATPTGCGPALSTEVSTSAPPPPHDP